MKIDLFKDVVIAAAILAVLSGAWIYTNSKSQAHEEERVHYHAGFQMYVEDELQDFSGLEYMEVKPCTDDELHEDDTIHFHNGVGDVAHVHASGMKWQNVYEYLNEAVPFKFYLEEEEIEVYVNGEKVENFLDQPVEPYESVVMFVGRVTGLDDKLSHAVTREHIVEVENSKEGCGT